MVVVVTAERPRDGSSGGRRTGKADQGASSLIPLPKVVILVKLIVTSTLSKQTIPGHQESYRGFKLQYSDMATSSVRLSL